MPVDIYIYTYMSGMVRTFVKTSKLFKSFFFFPTEKKKNYFFNKIIFPFTPFLIIPIPLKSRSFSITRPAPLVKRSLSGKNFTIHQNHGPRITAKVEPTPHTSKKHLASSVLTKGPKLPHLPICKCASCEEQLEAQLAHDSIIEEVARKLKSPAFEALLNQRVSLTTDQL